MSDPHTLTLNGNKYDALSGKEIKIDSKSGNKPKANSPKNKRPTQFVDGFFGTKAGGKQIGKKPMLLSLVSKDDSSGHGIAPHANRITEHSKTLMRNVVNKPSAERLKQQSLTTKKYLDRAVTRGIKATAPARASVIEHANNIKKSEFVNKFSEMTAPANVVAPNPDTIQTSVNSEIHLKNLEHLSQIEAGPIEAARIDAPEEIEPKPTSKTLNPNSYNRVAQKLRMSTRALTIAIIMLVVAIAALIILYIFSSDIRMYAADNRTGIQGTLPNYTPNGYKLKSIIYQAIGANSSIVISYKANSGSGSYRIAEQYSSWDNQALLSTVVVPDSNGLYTTFDIAGRSVYIYKNSAAWIGTNVYYNLSTNNAQLTPTQISKIVSSS